MSSAGNETPQQLDNAPRTWLATPSNPRPCSENTLASDWSRSPSCTPDSCAFSPAKNERPRVPGLLLDTLTASPPVQVPTVPDNPHPGLCGGQSMNSCHVASSTPVLGTVLTNRIADDADSDSNVDSGGSSLRSSRLSTPQKVGRATPPVSPGKDSDQESGVLPGQLNAAPVRNLKQFSANQNKIPHSGTADAVGVPTRVPVLGREFSPLCFNVVTPTAAREVVTAEALASQSIETPRLIPISKRGVPPLPLKSWEPREQHEGGACGENQ